MKTIKNIYKQYLDKEFLRSYIGQVTNNKPYHKRVMGKLVQIVEYLYQEFSKGEFHLKPIRVDIRHDRKKDRDITFSPLFPNKIFDYLLAYPLIPLVKRSSFYWSIGNIEGKGKDMGVGYVAKNFRKYKYACHLDIKKFYENIDKYKLYLNVRKRIRDKDYLNFYQSVKGSTGKGLELGLASSQPLSNLFLMDFDYYIKQTLKIKVYVRSVDDIVIMGNNKMKLLNWIKQMSKYLNGLGLRFKHNWYITDKRIKFLGYIITKTHIYLQKVTFHKIGRLWKRMTNHSRKRAKTIISLKGWLQITTNFNQYYLKYLKPIMSFKEIKIIAYGKEN